MGTLNFFSPFISLSRVVFCRILKNVTMHATVLNLHVIGI